MPTALEEFTRLMTAPAEPQPPQTVDPAATQLFNNRMEPPKPMATDPLSLKQFEQAMTGKVEDFAKQDFSGMPQDPMAPPGQPKQVSPWITETFGDQQVKA